MDMNYEDVKEMLRKILEEDNRPVPSKKVKVWVDDGSPSPILVGEYSMPIFTNKELEKEYEPIIISMAQEKYLDQLNFFIEKEEE